MNRLEAYDTALSDLKVIERKPIEDARGVFLRLFCAQELASVGWTKPISQINWSLTEKQGSVRGLHFQTPPYAEMKMVSCLRGAVWDIVVDIRMGSPTFLQWHAEELSSQNARMMIVPEGFAHGFQVLDPDSEMLYLHTAFYTPEKASGVPFDDPRLASPWPLTIPVLSSHDKQHPPMSSDFSGIKI